MSAHAVNGGGGDGGGLGGDGGGKGAAGRPAALKLSGPRVVSVRGGQSAPSVAKLQIEMVSPFASV